MAHEAFWERKSRWRSGNLAKPREMKAACLQREKPRVKLGFTTEPHKALKVGVMSASAGR